MKVTSHVHESDCNVSAIEMPWRLVPVELDVQGIFYRGIGSFECLEPGFTVSCCDTCFGNPRLCRDTVDGAMYCVTASQFEAVTYQSSSESGNADHAPLNIQKFIVLSCSLYLRALT